MNKTLIAIAISSFLVNPPVFAGHNDILKPSPSTKAGRDKPGQSADQSPSALQTNTAAEMAAFTHDPRAFLTEHTVDVIEIIKHGILPSGLSQARLEPSFGGFQVRLAEVPLQIRRRRISSVLMDELTRLPPTLISPKMRRTELFCLPVRSLAAR